MTAETLILEKLSQVQADLHDLRRMVQTLRQPVNLLTAEGAGLALGVGAKTVKIWSASGIFTDARPPDRRKTTARVYYADEIEAYRTEGPAGVMRLREKLGRV